MVLLEVLVNQINAYGSFALDIDQFKVYIEKYKTIMTKRFGWQYHTERRKNRSCIKSVSDACNG